jgi:hypothetical protein
MCLVTSSLRSYHRWNWEGDQIIPDPIILAARTIPGTTKRYDIDIREYLISQDNAVIRRELGQIVSALSAKDAQLFNSRLPGSFDFRAELITSRIGKRIKYDARSERGFDTWKFPDETLSARRGDCEDIAFLLASLLLASGISGYMIRVVLGNVRDAEASHDHAHIWVMYKNENGSWMLLDPLLHTTDARPHIAQSRKEKRKPVSKRFEYIPYYLFNDRHLWTLRTTEKLFKDYLGSRRFWKTFDPKFATSVHNDILWDALYDKGGPLSLFQYNQVKAISFAADANISTYSPFDHFDNGYIDESWKLVLRRLKTGSLTDLALAGHAIGDFYAHSSYAHFGPVPGGKLTPYDPKNPGSFAAVYDQGSFNLNNYSTNQSHCADKAGVISGLRNKIISGRYAQPGETFRRKGNHWLKDSAEWATPYPDDLEGNNELAMHACLPHHEEIAVDSTDMEESHKLYRDPSDPGKTAYLKQFYMRKEAATTQIRQLCANWKEK